MTEVPNVNQVTLREVYSLLQSLRLELLAAIDKASVHVDTEFTLHEARHEREKEHRASLIRWAVTTIIAFLGLIGLFISLHM